MGKAVKQLVTQFVSELEGLIEEEVIAKVGAALRRPGRVAAKAPVAAPNGKPARKVRLAAEKRTPKELEKLRAKIISFATHKPGQRSEDMQKGLKLGPLDIALPLKQLLQSKLLRSEGAARGRRYWVTGGANGTA